MNYLNAPKHTVFAATSAFAITVVISASIIFGMAGLPTDSATAVASGAQVQPAQAA